MAETVIFAEQPLEFLLDSSGGMYVAQGNDDFPIEAGRNYRVVWDGEEFNLVAFNFSTQSFDGIGIGCETFLTGQSTEFTEPFAIYYLISVGAYVIATPYESTSHTVGIYLVEEVTGVVVKDRTGADVEHIGASAIRVRTTDGGTKKFLDSDTMQPLEVTENGTYAVEGNSCGYSPVTVKVPDPVLQEKTITENGEYTADSGFDGLGKVTVDVAGSGGTLVCESGTFTGNGTRVTVPHGLGTVPIFVYCYKSTGIVSTIDNALLLGLGFSTEAADAAGMTSNQQYGIRWNNYAGKVAQTAPSYPIDTTRISGTLINNATETSVTFGGTYKVENGTIYNYVVLGIKPE